MDNNEKNKDTKEDVKKKEQKVTNEKHIKNTTKKENTNNKKEQNNNEKIVEARKDVVKNENNTKDNENSKKETTNPKTNADSKKVETKTEDKTQEVENKTDVTDLIKREDIEIDEKKLSKINEEIKENKKKSRNNEIKNEKYVRILRNVVIAVIGIAYISISLMGSKRIPEEQYLLDLKVFIILGVISAILLFEKAFKTDKFRYALVGIEVLVLSSATIMLLHLYKLQNANILKYSKYFLLIWSVYYLIKNIIIAIKRTDINKKEDENN